MEEYGKTLEKKLCDEVDLGLLLAKLLDPPQARLEVGHVLEGVASGYIGCVGEKFFIASFLEEVTRSLSGMIVLIFQHQPTHQPPPPVRWW